MKKKKKKKKKKKEKEKEEKRKKKETWKRRSTWVFPGSFLSLQTINPARRLIQLWYVCG